MNNFRNFRTVKDVQAWLGLSGFYRGYLRNYAQRTWIRTEPSCVRRGVRPVRPNARIFARLCSARSVDLLRTRNLIGNSILNVMAV